MFCIVISIPQTHEKLTLHVRLLGITMYIQHQPAAWASWYLDTHLQTGENSYL